MDGYGRLYEVMKSAADDGRPGTPVWTRLCTVLSTSPLRVDVCGTPQEAGRFHVPARMLDSEGKLTGLRAGDQVLLLTDDNQTFYLLDRVVHL